jgi:3-oxoacyl-[acyl-carrier protein] reductase
VEAEPLNDRVVVVTGASRSVAIGAAIVRRLVADGASVLLHSWVPYDLEQPYGAGPSGPEALVSDLRRPGGRVSHLSADLADPDAPAALVAWLLSDEADWVTGQTIASDGGWSSR